MANARAETTLRGLLRKAGAEPVRLESGELEDLQPPARLCALVYDLRPLDGDPVARLRRLRGRFPGWPVLLHPPARPAVGDALLACGELRQVRARLQLGRARAIERLKEAVRWLTRATPPATVRAEVDELLADAPSLARRYAGEVLEALAREGRAGRVTVRSAADRIPASLRTLQRTLKAEGLPPPKELRDRLVLLALARGAARLGVRTCDVARMYGMDGQALYRLRRRLLDRPPEREDGPGDEGTAATGDGDAPSGRRGAAFRRAWLAVAARVEGG